MQLTIFDSLPEDDKMKNYLIREKSTDWKWSFVDYPPKNGLKVFSCFACGGGSTMGYKLAGCDVIGDCELDKRMNDVYVKNHHPKYNYLMDIRDFNNLNDLPEELYHLDILDGSPPCSTFSMAGKREDAWGKEKKFREGQKVQTLDDLVFVFIETVAKLKPKVAIMENVEGLLLGRAWKYVEQIYKRFHDIGYKVRHELLKGEDMGVPQTRHRVFFIATRLDFDLQNIDLKFYYEPVIYGEVKCGEHKELLTETAKVARQSIRKEKLLSDTMVRLRGKRTYFTEQIIYEDEVCKTITAGGSELWIANTGTHINDAEIISIQTFPQDYDFCKAKVKYICGMSVPPLMIKRLVTRLIDSGIFKR